MFAQQFGRSNKFAQVCRSFCSQSSKEFNQRSQVLQAYRKLLKTQQQVFRQDFRAQAAAKIKIKTAFENRRSETNKELIDKYIQEAHETADFLKHNIVQAVRNDTTGVYQVKFDRKLDQSVTLSTPWLKPNKAESKKNKV